MPLKFLISIFVAWCPLVMQAQVYINEVCSSNATIVEDEDGDTSDWIELYNSSNVAIDLTGYFISDDSNDTTKWQFESGNIAANSYLVLFASGKNRTSTTPLHTSFKLSQNGESVRLYNPNQSLIDSITIPFLSTDISYGSISDGSSERAYFPVPTAGFTNNGSPNVTQIMAYRATFSFSAGVYSENFLLEISTQETNPIIRYTLDGSEPTVASAIYADELAITKTTIVNAKVYKSGLLPSTNSVVNYVFEERQTLPIVCLSTHPNYFFHPDTGIYVFGPNAEEDFPFYGANFWSDTEIPIHVQWFDISGKLGFEQKLGARIHGGSVSRTRVMRSLRLLAKSKYGKSEIAFSLFTNKFQPTNKRFVLRNSGSDFLKTGLRDGFIHTLFIEDSLLMDAVSYRPVELYLNGEFRGIHNVREKVDRFYLKHGFGADESNLDMLEEQDQIMDGDFNIFDEMEATILALNLSNNANFEIADSLFDVMNMADYFISQTYLNNLDWPYNNLKYWRERKIGAKWRYIIFDLDATLGGVSFAPVNLDNLGRVLGPFGDDNRHVLIFRKLLENETYRNYFINRYCDLVNTTFGPKRFTQQLEKEVAIIEPVVEKHFNRWNGDLQKWYDQLEIVQSHIDERPPYAIGFLQDFFQLDKQANIHLNVYPPEAGKIALNSLLLRTFPFNGIYFENIPISVTIEENPGFKFSHWESNRPNLVPNQKNLGFLPADGDSLIAVFAGNSNYTSFSIYPNPAMEAATAEFVLNKKQQVSLFLVELRGQTKYKLYSGQLFSGTNRIELNLPENLQGAYLLTLITKENRYTKKIILLNND